MDLVFVKPTHRHEIWKGDCTWKCANAFEAQSLAEWLREMGLNAHQIDQETFDAMPEKMEEGQ
jgi:hypothetical protein